MEYYSEISKGYDELYKEEQLRKFNILKEKIKLRGRILDIGAGTGFIGKDIIRLDPSLEMLKKAKGMRVCGVGERLPFRNNVFDAVISITALHHTDIKKVVREIKRVLKKNGKIGFSLLKKSKNFKEEVRIIRASFKVREEDEGKDLILFT